MKKFTLLLILCISLFFPSALAETDNITVLINGETLNSPIPAQLVNNRTMLPMRAVFEKLGAHVTWINDDEIIFADKGDTLVTFKIGVPQMVVQTASNSENTVIELDTAPFISGDYTLVPVRAAAEAFNAQVGWIDETNTVTINIGG